jgi:DNA-binding NtrC family response regulator
LKVEEIRSEFKVLTVDCDFQSSHALSDAVKSLGYQAYFYPTLDSALIAVKLHNPHILILNYVLAESEVDPFLVQVRKLSPEIKIILLASPQQSLTVLSKVASHEIYDYLIVPAVSTSELVVKVDRLATQLYLGFENEQLRKRRGFADKDISHLGFEETAESLMTENLENVRSYFREVTLVNDQEQLIQKHILALFHSK